MNRFKIGAVAISVLLMLVVVLQNTQETTVRLFFAKLTMPLALLLGLMLTGGFVCGLVGAMVLGRKATTRSAS